MQEEAPLHKNLLFKLNSVQKKIPTLQSSAKKDI